MPARRDTFIDGMRLAATGVSVVTTMKAGVRTGVTVSALCSLSADPPSLLVCIHHRSRAVEAILASRCFCVNLLSDGQSELSEVFAGRAPTRGDDRFAAAEWMELATGAPGLVGALVTFDCALVKTVRWGSHHILIGEVRGIEIGSGQPLVYCNRGYAKLNFDEAAGRSLVKCAR